MSSLGSWTVVPLGEWSGIGGEGSPCRDGEASGRCREIPAPEDWLHWDSVPGRGAVGGDERASEEVARLCFRSWWNLGRWPAALAKSVVEALSA